MYVKFKNKIKLKKKKKKKKKECEVRGGLTKYLLKGCSGGQITPKTLF